MATKSQIDKLASRIDALANTFEEAIKVTVFRGETAAFAMQRHRELRPEHAGRRVRFEYVDGVRSAVFAEEVAVWTATGEEADAFEAGFSKLLQEIDEKTRDNILSLPTTPEEKEAERA